MGLHLHSAYPIVSRMKWVLYVYGSKIQALFRLRLGLLKQIRYSLFRQFAWRRRRRLVVTAVSMISVVNVGFECRDLLSVSHVQRLRSAYSRRHCHAVA